MTIRLAAIDGLRHDGVVVIHFMFGVTIGGQRLH